MTGTMTKQELIEYCLTLPGAYEDYPFDEFPGDHATAVIRHRGNRRSFALIMEHSGQLYLNLKCAPAEADFLRCVFKGVIPGYHMNKEHWNTVVMGSDVPEDEILRQINGSYNLIRPNVKSPKNSGKSVDTPKKIC